MYTIAQACFIIRWVELIAKREFVVIADDLNNKTFVVHIALPPSFNLGLKVHLSCKVQIASWKADKALISIFSELEIL